MKRIHWILLSIGILAAGYLSYGSPRVYVKENYIKAVKSGFARIPEAEQIESLFGEADHFISYSGRHLPQYWYTEAFFDGRYVLTMEVEVKTNYSFSAVTDVVGEPRFYLCEVKKVDAPNQYGRVGASFSNQWEFSLEDWKKILAKGGISAIGISIKVNEPIENFDAYVKALREPRLRVRPD